MPFGSALFAVWATLVAWSDCRDRRVANWLVLAGGAAAMACAVVHAAPFGVTPVRSLLGFIVGFCALLPFFLLRVMGAADVKVFAVLGAWCGARALLGVWVAASIAAGLHALALLVAAAAATRSGRLHAWSPWRDGQPTFAVGTRRATPYAALLVGAASLYWLGNFLQGAMR